jgi:hypothetical protein
MRWILVIFILLLFCGCHTSKVRERIVVSDTTNFVIIDTTRLTIEDTLTIYNRIDIKVFDTLYNFVDSVVVREIISKAENNITTTFRYDTTLVDDNKLLWLNFHYDGSRLFINYDLKQLLEGSIIRERVEKTDVES